MKSDSFCKLSCKPCLPSLFVKNKPGKLVSSLVGCLLFFNFDFRPAVTCSKTTTQLRRTTKGAFFWENPKTDLWSQIIWILHYQKKMEDPIKDHLPWQRHVLVLLVGKKKKTTTNWPSRQEEKATLATYEYTKCIYFGLKHKRFSNRIHS